MRLLALSADDIRRALPITAAIEATKAAFADLSAGRATVPQRATLPVRDDALFLVKPAVQPEAAFGSKLLSYFPNNPTKDLPTIQGVVVLFDSNDGSPAGVCDGGFLTAWRTAAATGAATDLLAREDASRAVLFGAGAQARTQVLALDAARPLERIAVCARSLRSAERFAEEVDELVSAQVVAVETADLAEADVVCTATPATSPLFEGASISPGCHVNCIGSFRPDMREVDSDLIARSRVFVDSRGPVSLEAGELIHAVERGISRPEEWTEIGEVVEGLRPGRSAPDEITLFKSVGVAVQDTAAGAAALAEARRLGIGTQIDL